MSFVRGVGIVLALALGAGCAGEELAGLPDTPYQALASARVTSGAVALAVGATHQLTVMAQDTSGASVTGLAPTFRLRTAGDSVRVRVDSMGVLRGIATGSNMQVIVSVTSADVTYGDTVFVTVTASASQASSLTVTPDPVTLEPSRTQTLTATVRTSAATVISGLGRAYYVSTDPGVVTVTNSNGRATSVSPGQAKIIGRMTVHGTSLVDTITVTVINPRSATVFMYPTKDASHQITFLPGLVQISVGGTVTWENNSEIDGLVAQSMDVTFDNPGAVTGGNIPAFTSGSQSRTFPTAGTYTYRSTTNGATGTVIVQ